MLLTESLLNREQNTPQKQHILFVLMLVEFLFTKIRYHFIVFDLYLFICLYVSEESLQPKESFEK